MFKRVFFALVLAGLSAPGLSGAVKVFEGHPRLFFRDKAWGERTVTTDVIRARFADPRYKVFIDKMTRRGPQNLALRAMILDDRESAKKCIAELERPADYGNTTDAGLDLAWDAMAFDWLYHDKDFSEASKQKAIAKLAAGAEWCMDLYSSQGTHIFHTRMYAYPEGVAIAGLALKGHHPDADKYIDWAYNIYLKDLFPARQIQDGSVHSSIAYGRKYMMWQVGHFIAAWYSATGENLWEKIRREQGDWAWREALFCIYAQQPDGQLVRYGDCFDRSRSHFSFRVISERSFYYNEPVGFGYINYLFASLPDLSQSRQGMEMGNEYQAFLYWDANNPGISQTTLPKRIMFSPKGTGMAFWRSGWGDNDTFIFFKCGDYFDNHGHFDAGHVEVFRHAPLLIEAGTYAGGTDTDHYKKFFHQSIAHNTIQIVNPEVAGDDGSQRFYSNQGQGTIEQYLANPLNEYGNIVQYQDQGDWAYLAADFTAAYEPGRVKQVVRELAWLGDRYLVVVDNVSLASGRFKPVINWHYTVYPQVEKRRFTVSDKGARAVVNVLAPENAVIDTVAAFKVGNAFYPPKNPGPSIGIGRAEVSVPAAGASDYVFVQVIDVADNDVSPAAPSLAVDRTSGTLNIDLPAGRLTLSGKAGAARKALFVKR